MTSIFSATIGAVLFAAAGRLGTTIAQSRYGTLCGEADGPEPLTIPRWAFMVASACVGFLVMLRATPPAHVAILLVAVLSLTVCAATDARTGIIPDLFTLGPLALVLAVSAADRTWGPLWGASFAFVPFAAMALISRGRGMGWGDVKLAAFGGALAGMGGIALAVIVASLAAYAAALLTGRARRPIAFGPYLAASIAASIALGTSA